MVHATLSRTCAAAICTGGSGRGGGRQRVGTCAQPKFPRASLKRAANADGMGGALPASWLTTVSFLPAWRVGRQRAAAEPQLALALHPGWARLSIGQVPDERRRLPLRGWRRRPWRGVPAPAAGPIELQASPQGGRRPRSWLGRPQPPPASWPTPLSSGRGPPVTRAGSCSDTAAAANAIRARNALGICSTARSAGRSGAPQP